MDNIDKRSIQLKLAGLNWDVGTGTAVELWNLAHPHQISDLEWMLAFEDWILPRNDYNDIRNIVHEAAYYEASKC
jgi:hypothetical protein